MKNLVKVIALVFVMALGVQTTSAQSLSRDQDRPEVIAKKTVADLSETLDLTGDQQRTLFRAYVVKETSYNKRVKGKDVSNPTVAASKKEIDEQLTRNVKSALSDAQFKKWQSLQKQ
ncbi:MAG: hypothetical protein MK211_10380 [Flavobacteriales bacterium]|jgi:hypothetical protein|uniref:hypothetical protein n=1 Tax=Candidatus Ulvibacter alkanivorans TaxID=2267620 RepID=UPI000DF3757D|nr:hypothetical protein [Candidatus Ulvibacter alkanivorans]MCH2490544.1 hypothetical protein [Flavobacteriales bacterium]|tara:strand:- start:231 stop:581 length:351 start_codon:yes stop_codon:yes gene_type:complete